MSAQPIRVLHLAKSLGLGGTEKVMQLLACGLDRERFKAAVLSPSDGERAGQIRAAGLETYITRDPAKAIRDFAPQVIHVHRAGWPEPDLLRPLMAAPSAVVVETNVFGRHDPSPSGQIIDCHLFVSRFCAERFAATTGIAVHGPRYGVLYNPVDTEFFAAACPPRDLSAPVIGRLSRPDPGKWSRLALDILPLLARSTPGFRCRIIGAVPEALEFTRAGGLNDRVSFEPPALTDQDLASFFNSISVLAHANDTGESFGLVIAEAMAAGLPVVTHPCPGLRDNAQMELVEHGRTGLVAQGAEDYARAVGWLLQNPDKAAAMGARAREKAQRLFNVKKIVKELEDLYLKLLDLKSGGQGDAA
ncbi:MAG: glycosyltransferase family 4 protein [Desulfovibrionaceae bacterium]|nr:glycosyltransferase family 4 protein [Desulfovibrionaceae bacterium]